MKIERTIKEVARHLILKGGLNDAYLALRARSGQNVEHLRSRTLAERFSAIYRNRVWLNDRADGSLSGLGSDFENTKAIRLRLPDLLVRLNTKTLLDIGCGDFGWLHKVAMSCNYIGVDCVQSVIDLNTRTHGSANRSFYALDATKDPLPPADTVLCREVLFHLSFQDISAVMRNVIASGAKNLITTTDSLTDFNSDILSGDFRILNLNKSPFSFPPADLWIPDDGVTPGRGLGVWNLSKLSAHRAF